MIDNNKRLLILGKSGGGGVQSDWAETDDQSMAYIKNKPELSVVATSGSYNDLLNKPTIPDAQVNSDWNSETGVSQILNKPTLSTVATSGSYNDLIDKPTFSTVATTGSYNDLSDKPTIPSNTVPMQVEFADGTSTTYNVYIQ